MQAAAVGPQKQQYIGDQEEWPDVRQKADEDEQQAAQQHRLEKSGPGIIRETHDLDA